MNKLKTSRARWAVIRSRRLVGIRAIRSEPGESLSGLRGAQCLWLRLFWQTGRPEFGAGSRAPVRAGTSAKAWRCSPAVRAGIPTPRRLVPTTSGAYFEGDRDFNVDRFDHASSPYAGG